MTSSTGAVLARRRDRIAIYAFMAGWSFLLALTAYRKSRSIAGDDWSLLRAAGRTVAGLDPHIPALHVYAVQSGVQVGPAALALDGLAQRWLGGDPFLLVVIALLAGLSVWALEQLGARDRRLLVMGLALSTVWATLGGWGHVEDAVALTAILCAAVTIRSGRPVPTGLLLGFAVACKPWALIAAPILLGLPRRGWWRATLALAVVGLIPWLPFLLADRQTLDVTRYSWPITTGSGLHALGFSGTTGTWLRPVQIGLGAAACAAVAWRRWMWAPMAGFAVKVLLDPEAWAYYGLVPTVGALLVDVDREGRVPWWSLSAVVVMFICPAVLPASVSGVVRAAWAVAVVGALLAGVWRRQPSRVEPARELQPA